MDVLAVDIALQALGSYRGGTMLFLGFGTGLGSAMVVEGVVEESGRKEFEFQYGEDFASHIEAFNPTFCKVLVRYNPEGDQSLNRRQAARLHRLSHYLKSKGRSRMMFELLVPPEKGQLDRLKGDKKAYDVELRPKLMVGAIEQLQDAGVEPDLWKIEGLDRCEDCEKIVAAARRGGRNKVSCIILGRGADGKKASEWLKLHLRFPDSLVSRSDGPRSGSLSSIGVPVSSPGGCRCRGRATLPGVCWHFRAGEEECRLDRRSINSHPRFWL